MIRYLHQAEKQFSRNLWQEAFGEDSQTFVDYYYQEKIKDNRVLAHLDDHSQELRAMLQLNPYHLQVGGRRWQIDYIVGVATSGAYRRRGYMRELLVRMFAELYQEEMPFVFLMPAAPEIYWPYDFSYIFDQPVWQLRPDVELWRERVLLRGDGDTEAESRRRLDELAQWTNQWLKNAYQVYTIRDAKYLETLIKELESENGWLDKIYDQQHLIGLQAEWGTGHLEQRLLYCEPQYRVEKTRKPAIMARIVCLGTFLQAIHLHEAAVTSEMCIRLDLHDPWIAANNGVWDWHLNKQRSWLAVAEAEVMAAELNAENGLNGAVKTDLLTLTISELTSWLFGYIVPTAAVPYQDIVCPLSGVFLDEVV